MWKKPIKIRYKLCAPRDPNLKHSEKHWYETLANIIYYVCLCLYKTRKKERLKMWAGSCIRYRSKTSAWYLKTCFNTPRSLLEVQEGMCSDGVKSLHYTLVAGYEWNSWLVGRADGVMSWTRRTTEDARTGLLSRADVTTTAPLLIRPVTMLCEGQL